MDLNALRNAAANSSRLPDPPAIRAVLKGPPPEEPLGFGYDEDRAEALKSFGFQRPWPKTLAECEAPEFVPKMLDLFDYDPATGFIWQKYNPRSNPLSRMTTIGRSGFGRVSFYELSVASAKLVWFIHHRRWPRGQLRHLDDDKANDRIENLAEARRAPSRLDEPLEWVPGGLRRVRKNPSRGVARCGPDHWQAYCRVDGKQKSLGRFDTEAEALAARAAWERGEERPQPAFGTSRVRKVPSRGVARSGPNHWQAYCRVNGEQTNLGRFKTEAEALAARAAWELGVDLV